MAAFHAPPHSFHTLAEHVPAAEIDPEIAEKLDVVADAVAGAARGSLP